MKIGDFFVFLNIFFIFLHSIDSFSLDPALFQFITVTSYQNPVVTDLKLKHNPAARNPSSTLWKQTRGIKRKSLNDSAYNSSFSSDPPSPKRFFNAIGEDGFLHEPVGKVTGVYTISYGEPLVPELIDEEELIVPSGSIIVPDINMMISDAALMPELPMPDNLMMPPFSEILCPDIYGF